MNKHELKNIELFEEDGQYYLKLKYIVEHEHRTEEIEIPKARVPFNKKAPIELTQSVEACDIHDHFNFPRQECYLHTGYNNSLELKPGNTSEASHAFYIVKTIKEKAKEMTLDEIEKKLGHKVKIINK